MRALMLLIPLLCSCGSGTIKGNIDNNGDVDDGAGDDSGQTEPGDAEPEPEPEPTIEDWEGDWVGIVVIDPFGEDYFEGCTGELELDVDLDGEVDGDGYCEYGWSGAGMEFEGEITAEGDLSGTLIIDFQYAGETYFDLTGGPDGEDTLVADFEGLYEITSWGGDTTTYDAFGYVSVDRD